MWNGASSSSAAAALSDRSVRKWGLGARLRGFCRDQDGALIIFGLMLFILMLMIGGLAVDLMRHENTRTRLQNTLDRSVLAAAALNQTRPPADVVRDYMLKAGLTEQLDSVQVTGNLSSSRTVSAVGVADTKPIFLHMMGIDRLDATSASEARQTASNIEIVMVLDVSGSMMNNNRLVNLKIAAKKFIDTVLDNDRHKSVSIAIVPYSAQVNTGPDLAGVFTVKYPNGAKDAVTGLTIANCFEPKPSDFTDSLALSRIAPLSMAAYADIDEDTPLDDQYYDLINDTGRNQWNYNAKPNYDAYTSCRANTYNAISLPSNDRATLKAKIDGLQTENLTSITLGMKWGATMLDPSMRSAYTEFINTGKMPPTLPNRPFDYNDPMAAKYVILMTDGEQTDHYRIADTFKYGPSSIFKSAADGKYSVRIPNGYPGRPPAAGTNEYYVPHLATATEPWLGWQSTPWNGGVEQGWQDIWQDLKLSYVIWQFYMRPLGLVMPAGGRLSEYFRLRAVYRSRYNEMAPTYATIPDMDASLNNTCDFVKAQGVTVFGIAFEATARGETVIRNCSTDGANGSHYFDVTGTQINTAFDAIASTISQLKLTQ